MSTDTLPHGLDDSDVTLNGTNTVYSTGVIPSTQIRNMGLILITPGTLSGGEGAFNCTVQTAVTEASSDSDWRDTKTSSYNLDAGGVSDTIRIRVSSPILDKVRVSLTGRVGAAAGSVSVRWLADLTMTSA